MTGAPWWTPDAHADRRPFLVQRGKIRRVLGEWFRKEGFLEVECGALQVSPGNETHLHAFKTDFQHEGGGQDPYYLHTSPEFSCKKLLTAGEEKIVDFARVFRNRESGPLHSPEFTMVEWYRTGEGLPEIMRDAVTICQEAANATGRTVFTWKDHVCPAFAEPEMLSLAEAFTRYVGFDLEAVLDDRDSFARAAEEAGVHVSEDASWSDIFSAVLVTKVEPNLGMERLTILHRYPVCEAALARACPDDPRFADRFELYGCGVELANGFHELTDPEEQRKRFEADMALKAELYGERYPLDEDFLTALSDMPDASGCALGFDRLVVLATGARSVHDVNWTPFGP
ncbi:MAG: EF-P lysine aminoacylase GenX [Ponticaulis sp.]|nr:EF-P lysine aminoacylase GenX [Ponticaulis sp.]